MDSPQKIQLKENKDNLKVKSKTSEKKRKGHTINNFIYKAKKNFINNYRQSSPKSLILETKKNLQKNLQKKWKLRARDTKRKIRNELNYILENKRIKIGIKRETFLGKYVEFLKNKKCLNNSTTPKITNDTLYKVERHISLALQARMLERENHGFEYLKEKIMKKREERNNPDFKLERRDSSRKRMIRIGVSVIENKDCDIEKEIGGEETPVLRGVGGYRGKYKGRDFSK